MLSIRAIRISSLLLVLAIMAIYTKTQKLQSRSWSTPLEVVIYPINGDHDNPKVANYINNLDSQVFKPIDDFFKSASQIYNLTIENPTITKLGAPVNVDPPKSPPQGSSDLDKIWWGIKFRLWAIANTPDSESNLHRIRVFVHYHEALVGRKLEHSLGMDKGLLAVVHAFAEINQDQQNNVVIAHEILHTVGATDKYGDNGEPVFPIGYAAPERSPNYPEKKAEIMAGRIPLSLNTSKMPKSLNDCVINPFTAQEINWLHKKPAI